MHERFEHKLKRLLEKICVKWIAAKILEKMQEEEDRELNQSCSDFPWLPSCVFAQDTL